jgi:hypothetical protein
MKEKLMFAAVAFVVCGLAGSALALSPVGKPTAGLTQGQVYLGVDYGYSDVDIDVPDADESINGANSNAIMGRVGYGLMDVWELYGLVGVADAEWEDFDSSFDFAYGFGTKYTFMEGEELDWGVAFQMQWLDVDDDVTDEGTDYDVDMDFYEMVIAVGPTWEMRDDVRIYGGPVFYMLDGDLDVKEVGDGSESFGLEESSNFGGYVGAEVDLSETCAAFTEFMFTGDAWFVGAGVGWKM